MKKKSSSQSAFFNPRTLTGLVLFLFAFALSLFAAGVLPGPSKAPQGQQQAAPGSQRPDIIHMVGPVLQNRDLRLLPYIAPNGEAEETRRTRYPFPRPANGQKRKTTPNIFEQIVQSAIRPQMPTPLQTFDTIDSNLSGCGCLPPDTDGDVGSNHYISSENSSIQIYDKVGNVLTGPITYNSFFSALGTGTPCGNNQNDGDGIVFYDHIADRWVVSDFAFPAAGTINYQCIGVSKTADPVAGGWYLYAVQVDPANPTWIGDYPKFGLWPDAYYLSVNTFVNVSGGAFTGVRVFAFDRNSMLSGGSANTISFPIAPADLGDQYSLVPATFRTGAPPAGQPEWFMSVNSSTTPGMVESQVFVRRFHVDFVTPSNSTFGVGATAHSPDGTITVNGFIDAFTGTTSNLAPNGTATTSQWLDTLGDKLMYPLVYQNINGKEYVYADQTVAPSNNGTTNTGPTAVRWYQFDMTGNTIPATPAQQQDWTNNNDGLFRWMPSINVDGSGNMSIGYSASSSTVNPGVRVAGRLVTDPPNTLYQGESILWTGTGHQTSTSGRWGDYSSMFVDPTDNCTFYHTNEYYSVTSNASWRTRVGLFKYPTCTGSPLPTPSPTASPTATPTPTPTPTPTATPGIIPTPTPTPTPTPSPTPPASAGPVTVVATAATTGPTDYATVQLAFAAINSGTHQGAIQVWVMGDTTETVTAVLNASGSGSASYGSVLMLPNGTRTVTGNLAAPLIDLNGAKNVRIDGYGQMALSNTNTGTTAGTSTVRFINGAQNDILANCSVLGSSTVALGTAGGNVLFSTTTGTGVGSGNNNNTVFGNNIGPAGANLPIKCITGLGTAGNNTVNTGDLIDNNNIFDFFNAASSVAGIDMRAGNQNWIIQNNRIYQTATRTFTGAAGIRYSGILFSGTTGANGNFHTIKGNIIGFGAANGTGTTTITGTGTGAQNEVRGIDIQGASSGTATNVWGNIISGINQTSARASTTTGLASFGGIHVATSAGASATGTFDIGSVTGNAIGSLDGSSTIVINATSTTASTTPVFGILCFSGSSNNIANNQIGAITIQGTGTVTGFRGIFPGATAATTQTINNNYIGGAGAGGAITDTQLGNYAVYGIQASTAAGVITGNVIQNLIGNANVAGSVNESGIAFTSTSTTASSTISRNFIYNLSNSSGSVATNIYGLDVTMSTNANVTGNLVERNFIHSLSVISTDTTSQMYGIIIRGANTTGTATATVQNNMIRLGLDGSGNSVPGGLIRGIRDSAAGTGGNVNNSYYYNSVYIGGTGVGTASNTQAFFSDQTTSATSPRVIKNNIFYNARSTSSGAGKNYAIGVGGTAPNPPGLTSNNNDLYATGTAGFVGLYNATDQTTLANWQTASGQDANSISADPLFVNPTGTAATVNLHIQAGSPAIGGATPITSTTASPLIGITNDFDNDNRNPSTPDIGADERAPFVVNVSVTKTADAANVSAGSQIGFTVTISNTSSTAATSLNVTDALPAGTAINWTIDAGNTSPGWSVSGTPPNQNLVYTPTTLAANSSTTAHVVSNTTSASCATYTNTVSFTSGNDGSGIATASETVNCAGLSIAKTADAASVSAGSQIGFTVTMTNSGAGAATGLSITDNLPAGTDVNWTIDAGNTDPGWSVSGSPPNQSLVYSPTTLAGNTSTAAHVVSTTTTNSCGAYSNMASFSAANDGSGSASASETVLCPVVITSVVSEKTHPGAGTFDVDLTAGNGIECRSGGTNGNYSIIFTFSNNLTNVDSASVSCGSVDTGTSGIGPGLNQYTVNLTGENPCNQQYITVTLTNVDDSSGNHSNTVTNQWGLLMGDTTASGAVNSSDIAQTQSESGQTVTSSNFREDVTVNGAINSSDIAFVQSESGTALPP